MVIRFKHFRGRAIKEFRERDENNEDIWARTFKVHKEYWVNDFLVVRLEEIEHLYEEYFYEHQKNPDEFYDYEWVVRIYVEGIDEFTDERYNIHEYSDFFSRIKFLPWKKGRSSWSWDDTVDSSIEVKYNEICLKFEEWSEKNYNTNLLETRLLYPLLKKLIEAGDVRALDTLNEKIILNQDPDILINLKTYNLAEYVDEENLDSLTEHAIKEDKPVHFRGANIYLSEASVLMDFEKLMGSKIKLQQRCDYDGKAFIFWAEKYHVTELCIQSERNLKKIPESIGNLTHLRRLIFRWLNITELPVSMGNLKRLKSVEIYGCEIKWPDPLPKNAKDLVEYLNLKKKDKNEKVFFKDLQIDVVGGILNLNGLGINNMDDVNGFRDLKTLKHLRLSSCTSYDREREMRKKLHVDKDFIPSVSDRLGKNTVQIKDIPFIQNLESLTMKLCGLTTMEGVELFENLKYLDLGFNKITEIKGVKNFTALEKLDLRENEINEIRELENLINLQELILLDNAISELKGLENLQNLKTLYLSRNKKNIDLLVNNLEKLKPTGAQTFVDYCRVKKALNTSELSAKDYFYKIGKKNFVEVHGELYFLNENKLLSLRQKDIKDISEIEELDKVTELKALYLEKNQIAEIKGLDNLKELTTLNLAENQISEIKGLASLGRLQYLDLRLNYIKEIKGLDGLKALRDLNLRSNEISEIKNVAHLSTLKSLNLIGNHITEIAELEKLTNLGNLYIADNPVYEKIKTGLGVRDPYFELRDASLFVNYCRAKNDHDIPDLLFNEFLLLVERFVSIFDTPSEEVKKVYAEITELETVDCIICGTVYKEKKYVNHFETKYHINALTKTIEGLETLQIPEDSQFVEVLEFKNMCKKFYEKYTKNQPIINLKLITEIILIDKKDLRKFTEVLLKTIKFLLEIKNPDFDPPDSEKKEVLSQVSNLHSYVSNLQEKHLNYLKTLTCHLRAVISSIFDEPYNYEDVKMDNMKFCIVFFWTRFINLWEGIINDVYSKNEEEKIKTLAKFLEAILSYSHILGGKLNFRVPDEYLDRPWDFDPKRFRRSFLRYHLNGYMNKNYVIENKNYYIWFKTYDILGNEESKKHFKFIDINSKQPHFSVVECPQCKHSNVVGMDFCFECGFRITMEGYLKEEKGNKILIINDIRNEKFGFLVPKDALLAPFSKKQVLKDGIMKGVIQRFIVDHTKSDLFERVDFK